MGSNERRSQSQDASSVLPRLAARVSDSHKGDYGRALLVGGSRGMAGAIALAGMATLRSGAGLVTVAVPDPCLETVAGFEPCYMTVPLPCDDAGRLAKEAGAHVGQLAGRATAIACGPGLGRSAVLTQLVRDLYATIRTTLVLDADALNALAEHPDGLTEPAGPRILTPHPGEFDRLVHRAFDDNQQRSQAAIALAEQYGVVLVLKGHRTLITDGAQSQHNESGNPGMATGGSGDVLTGVITALLCQGMEPWGAARLGVHVHGLAGDCAARRGSQVALTAQDLVGCLPEAWALLS